jgi:hypothetical protein
MGMTMPLRYFGERMRLVVAGRENGWPRFVWAKILRVWRAA